MKKKRLRVTLGAWMVIVAALCVGAIIATRAALSELDARRRRNPAHRCYHNLQIIQNAKSAYVLAHGPFLPDTVVALSDIEVYQKDMRELYYCPLAVGTKRNFHDSYGINSLTSAPTCKIAPSNHCLDHRQECP